MGLYGAFDWNANKSFNEHGEHTWCHDSGATIFVNGNHICSISEERITRIKNDGDYPINSINYCLNYANIDESEVDYVYVPSMCVPIFYKKLHEGTINSILQEKFPNAKIKIISHHLSHAASSVFSSPFNEGSFLTIDGAGSVIFDDKFQMSVMAEKNTIGYFNKKKSIFRFFNGLPGTNDFGAYYHSNSHMLYCEKIQQNIHPLDEKYRETFDGKIMGLSAYGKDTIINEDHKHYETSKNLYYSDFPYVYFKNGDDIIKSFTFKNVDEKSYIIQNNFESAMLDYVSDLKEKNYLEDNLCLAGGSFLNVLGNSVIKNSGLFKNVHIPPFPNDVGLHFGAACYGQFENKEEINLPENIALLGKEYSENEIEYAILRENLAFTKYENFEDVCKFTAEKLSENKIIGWFQGRSEFGPRALGSRSLLMHPGPVENKDVMNNRVKHREYWRPFAGIILEDDLSDYFNEDFLSPYMIYSLTVKEDKIPEIAAITHLDNTCRIQTVNKKQNEKVFMLIEEFKRMTGTSLVLNTSFNDNGEPIIETPSDAIRAFLNLDIDHLVLGNFILSK